MTSAFGSLPYPSFLVMDLPLLVLEHALHSFTLTTSLVDDLSGSRPSDGAFALSSQAIATVPVAKFYSRS